MWYIILSNIRTTWMDTLILNKRRRIDTQKRRRIDTQKRRVSVGFFFNEDFNI